MHKGSNAFLKKTQRTVWNGKMVKYRDGIDFTMLHGRNQATGQGYLWSEIHQVIIFQSTSSKESWARKKFTLAKELLPGSSVRSFRIKNVAKVFVGGS